MTASNDAPPPRYQVVGGGAPSPEQVAALVIALTPVAVAPPERAERRVAPWAQAALLEGVGGRSLLSAADLSRAVIPGS